MGGHILTTYEHPGVSGCTPENHTHLRGAPGATETTPLQRTFFKKPARVCCSVSFFWKWRLFFTFFLGGVWFSSWLENSIILSPVTLFLQCPGCLYVLRFSMSVCSENVFGLRFALLLRVLSEKIPSSLLDAEGKAFQFRLLPKKFPEIRGYPGIPYLIQEWKLKIHWNH